MSAMENHKPYNLPENYNPADYPPVKLRNNKRYIIVI